MASLTITARTVRSIADFGSLPSQIMASSSREPRLLLAGDERTYVSRTIAVNCVPDTSAVAQYTACEWSSHFGVIVPLVSFVNHDDANWIGSEYHEGAAQGYNFSRVEPISAFTSLIVFDCLLGNSDRTRPNILVETMIDHDRILLIDHEQSTIATGTPVDPLHVLSDISANTSRSQLIAVAQEIRAYFTARPSHLINPIRAASVTCQILPAPIEARVKSRLGMLESIVDDLCTSRSIP